MNTRSVLLRALRVVAAVGIVGTATFIAAPLDAHHDVEFDGHNCPEPTPPPDEEPDLTPPPSDAPEDEPPAEPTPPPDKCMPPEGDRIWGTRVLAFSAQTDPARPIKRVALSILSQEKAIPHANDGKPLLNETYTREQDIRTYGLPCEPDEDTCAGGPFAWDSRVVTPYNGRYKVRVDVDTYPPFTGNDAHSATAERRDLRVDNAPVTPGAPKVIAKTIASVTLQWAAAPEPDVTAYTLYRAVTKTSTKPPASALKQIGITTGAAFRDTKIKPGFHWYALKVTRRSIITPETGISSPIGVMSGAAEIKAPSTDDDDETVQREIPDFRKPQIVPQSHSAGIPDAPFTYQLPVGNAPPGEEGGFRAGTESEPLTDPRGPVLPVAVGMFLVSSALAVGRMPY